VGANVGFFTDRFSNAVGDKGSVVAFDPSPNCISVLNEKFSENKNVIIYYNPNINEGLIGIIAARLKDYFNKPSIVITISNNILKGSARSVYNYNIGNVIKNLLDNNLISNKEYNEFKKKNIQLKKTKKVFLEDAQYYIEDVRKNIIEILTYEKVYNQGFNINTPINLELQKIATQSLRNGLIEYDKRKGWRGPLLNKTYSKKWSEGLEKYHLEN